MTKQAVKDLFIEFDEYGFEPTILCDFKSVIEHFHNAFKEILGDYEKFKCIDTNIVGINELKPGSYVSFDFDENIFFKVKAVNFSTGYVEYFLYDDDYNYCKIKEIKKIFNFNIDK